LAQAIGSDIQQQRVADLFRLSVPAWEQIYHRADVYSVIYQRRRKVALSLISELRLPSPSVLLEVGCGPGLITVELAQPGHRVYPMDIIPDMVAVTRRRAVDSGVGDQLRASVGDVRRLQFRGGSFDAVVVIGVAEWIVSLPDLLKELARVLTPDGYLVISSDNTRSLHHIGNPLRYPGMASVRRAVYRAIERYSSREPQSGGFAYSPKQFARSLREAGLVVLQTRQVGFGPFSLMGWRFLPESAGLRIDRALQTWADRGGSGLRSTGHVYVVVAKKLSANT
jgi:ubiquinone/menaquinone biosynthesis C-methylase UbiE